MKPYSTERSLSKRNLALTMLGGIAICTILASYRLPELRSQQGVENKTALLAERQKEKKKTSTLTTLEIKPEIDPKTLKPIPVTKDQLKEAVKIINRRLNSERGLGLGIEIVDHKIQVLTPGLSQEQAAELITPLIKRAKLSIHAVHRKSIFLADDVAKGKEIIPGYITRTYQDRDKKLNILIKRRAALTGKYIKIAWSPPNDYSVVNVTLTSEGGDKMKAFTTSLTKSVDQIATVLDDKVVNYATLNAESLGKNFVITGLDSKQEAEALVKALQNPLSHDIMIIKQITVDPPKPK